MSTLMRPDDVEVGRTNDTESSFRIAAALPDYFNAAGLEHMKSDLAVGELYGAFKGTELIGFVVYKGLNSKAVELAWLAVKREHWSCGVGTSLVMESLSLLPSHYLACQVKTLAATVPSPGYERTRQFYLKLGFIPLAVVDPYRGWGPGNPCQLMVLCLSR